MAEPSKTFYTVEEVAAVVQSAKEFLEKARAENIEFNLSYAGPHLDAYKSEGLAESVKLLIYGSDTRWRRDENGREVRTTDNDSIGFGQIEFRVERGNRTVLKRTVGIRKPERIEGAVKETVEMFKALLPALERLKTEMTEAADALAAKFPEIVTTEWGKNEKHLYGSIKGCKARLHAGYETYELQLWDITEAQVKEILGILNR